MSEEIPIVVEPLSPEEEAAKKEWEAGEEERQIQAVKAQRQSAYQLEADPIFFQAQRDPAFKMDDWHAKIAEIEERYPYPIKEAPKKKKAAE